MGTSKNGNFSGDLALSAPVAILVSISLAYNIADLGWIYAAA